MTVFHLEITMKMEIYNGRLIQLAGHLHHEFIPWDFVLIKQRLKELLSCLVKEIGLGPCRMWMTKKWAFLHVCG
jgi:hypothetical protein